jgi:hypothetical protein
MGKVLRNGEDQRFRHWLRLSGAGAGRNEEGREKNGDRNRWDVVRRVR